MLYKQLVDHIKNNQEKFYRVAYSYVKNREDALDIVQDATYKSLKSYKKLKSPEYLSTWFYRILINSAISLIRKNKKVTQWPADLILQSTEVIYLDLYDALEVLKPDDKTIVILRYFEDMKFKDIAEITNQNISTIKTKHTRILKQLKEILDWEVTSIE